jgi:hypothetical protein
MKEKQNPYRKTASVKHTANKKASGKKSATVKKKLPGKETKINYVAEITKIKNKLVALCIRLYKADKENQRLVCMILWGVSGREKLRGK